MLSVILFVLLFNLTYTSAQDIAKTGGVVHDSLQLGTNEHKIINKPKDTDASSADSSAKKPDNLQPKDSTVKIKIQNNPFLGENAAVNVAQDTIVSKVKKDTEVVQPQIQEIVKNHEGTSVHGQIEPHSSENKLKTPSENNNPPKHKSNITTIVNKTSTINHIRTKPKEDIIQSGALVRGFYVFVGLSVIVMIYFIFRSYRLRHGAQPSTTVRKYGITARRSDMEMRPLELDDDDDDTLFEIGSPSANR